MSTWLVHGVPRQLVKHYFWRCVWKIGMCFFLFSFGYFIYLLLFFSIFGVICFQHLKKNCIGVVDLQCCISFMCTAKWFSYTIPIIFQILFSYRLLQNTKFLVLCSRSLLVIYVIYSSVYMLIPSSWFIPPQTHFPLGNHKFVFNICKSVSVL